MLQGPQGSSCDAGGAVQEWKPAGPCLHQRQVRPAWEYSGALCVVAANGQRQVGLQKGGWQRAGSLELWWLRCGGCGLLALIPIDAHDHFGGCMLKTLSCSRVSQPCMRLT